MKWHAILPRHGAAWTAALVCAVFLPATAHAHALILDLDVVGATVRGEAVFVPGGPAGGAIILIATEDGNILEELETDEDGAFTYSPPGPANYVFTAMAAGGHRAERRLEASRLPSEPAAYASGPPPAPETPPAPVLEADDDRAVQVAIGLTPQDRAYIEETVNRRVSSLESAVEEWQRQIRFRDILGGIGYIVGIAGLLALLKSRQTSAN